MEKTAENHGINCMVCISTQQNTTNFLPFQQFGFDLMKVFETDYSRKKKWGERLKQVVEGKGKQILLHSLGLGTDLHQMVKMIEHETAAMQTVVWNIGGGQKMQQLAILTVFLKRNAEGKNDWACYADPGSKKIYEIRNLNNELVSNEIPIGTKIGLEDILTIFGLVQQTNSRPSLIWHSKSPNSSYNNERNIDVSIFYQKIERQKLISWAHKNVGEKPRVLEGLKHGFSDYFEFVVQHEVAKVLSDNFPNHHVSEAWANVRVKDPVSGKEIAEWDIVLVTDFGTLVILDAKTGIFESKDESARLFNLGRSTGVYGEFWVVIPYMVEDMVQDGFYDRQGKEGKKAKAIPFDFMGLQSRCLALTGQEGPVFLKKKKRDNVVILDDMEKAGNNREKSVLIIQNVHDFLLVTKLLKIELSKDINFILSHTK